jgi:hypothetical protein
MPLAHPIELHSFNLKDEKKVGRWLIKALPHGKLSPFQTFVFSKTIKNFIEKKEKF